MARTDKRAASPDPVSPPNAEAHEGSITGHIVDAAGMPLVGAKIEIVGTSRAVASDLDGEFLILLVPAGRIDLLVSSDGYTSQGVALDVHAGTRHERSFVLCEAPAKDAPREPAELVRVLAQAVRSYFGIPASVTIAVYLLESGRGEHLVAENNPFGIKAVGTELAAENGYARFRIMPHAFQRFGQILATREPYCEHTERLRSSKAPLEKRIEVYVRAIARIWSEDPKYAEKILAIIREDDLHRYDR